MITDFIIGVFHGVFVALINKAPDMPVRPAELDWLFDLLGSVGYVLPVSQFVAFLPVMTAAFGALAVWRAVRYLLPGG